MVWETILLSGFLQVVRERLLPLVLHEMKKLELDLEDEVNGLRGALSMIMSVIQDAEKKQEEGLIRVWLDNLKDVAYDANDLLDEVGIETLRRLHVEHFSEVREKFSPMSLRRLAFKRNVSCRFIEIRMKLDEMVNESSRAYNFLSSSTGRRTERRENLQTNSFLDGPVFGRSDDVSFILEWISNKYSRENFDVISIQGMAGVGKTTLAKMVFNVERLTDEFDVKIWVHTPQDPDVRKLFQSIMESLRGNGCRLFDLNSMQWHLQKSLEGKKYFLVLDDMSIEDDHYWENLKTLLSAGANGSKVLMTTCKRSIANLEDVLHYELKTLSEDDCIMVFNTHAFRDLNPEAYPNLNEIGKRIVEKCRGLPLAVKNFGRSLSRKAEQHHWDDIERWERMASKEAGEVLELHHNISHTMMSSSMKRCFAYCSTFPPGFRFKKEMLVQLWMAQDIVSSEEAGCEIFDYMFNWSLFDYLDFDYRKTQQTYVMHDCIRSTAQLMADGECCLVDQGNIRNLSHRTRHVSLVGNPNNMMSVDLSSVYVAKGLYSLLLISYQNMNRVNVRAVPDDLVMKLPRLRSLDLSNSIIEELPESIGVLKHLRYLALRNTRIKKLPNSVGELYCLQTLGLANCYELTKLPSSLKNLDKLIYLDLQLDDDSQPGALRSMPPKMSKLEGLRTLSRFMASKKKYCGVSELRILSNLRGDLCISNLDCIGDPHEAQLANLKDKTCLKVLELQWSTTDLRPRNRVGVEASVLEQLRPHSNLKELRIKGYAGDSFPAWMASPSTFSNLVTVKLIDCKPCNQLPPLGHLPALEQLFIKGMDGLMTIDCSFCGDGEGGAFRSLRKMHLESMSNLHIWTGDESCKLPSLRELILQDCNKLSQMSHSLPALTKLEIIRCSNLQGLRSYPSLSSLDVMEGGIWVWSSLRCLPSLSSLTINQLPMMVPPLAMQSYSRIRRLEIISCGTPEYWLPDWLPSGLTYLEIKDCPNLRALPGGLGNLCALEVLKIKNCTMIESLAEGMSKLVSLRSIELSDCPLISFLPSDGLPAGLQFLAINWCQKLCQRLGSDCFREHSKIIHVPTVLINGTQVRSWNQNSWWQTSSSRSCRSSRREYT